MENEIIFIKKGRIENHNIINSTYDKLKLQRKT